jgi:hypothetical protein
MVKMRCELHDELAASTQFVTHLTGRLLSKLHLRPSPIATQGFKALLQLVDNTCRDSFDLFFALYSHNPKSNDMMDQFGAAFAELRRELSKGQPLTPTAGASGMRVSRAVAGMEPSATVSISDLAIELKRQGKPVLSLSVGEPDFDPPPEVMAAAHEALDKRLVKYTALAGSHELRAAICRDLKTRKGLEYTPEQVRCCTAAK